MITLCKPDAVVRLLERPLKGDNMLRSISVSTPFLDERGLAMLAQIDATWPEYPFRLLTRPENAAAIRMFQWRRLRIQFLHGLHAKVYCALSVDDRLHEAIVSSANLTRAGVESNVELGLRVTGSTPECAALAARVDNWTRRAFAYPLAGVARR
jgi:hypothetical protein